MGIEPPNSAKIIKIHLRDTLSNCRTSYSYFFSSFSNVTDRVKKGYLNKNALTPTVKQASFTP